MRANVESKISENLIFTAGLSGVVSRRNTPRYAAGGGETEQYHSGWFSIGRQTIGMCPFIPETMDGYYTGSKADNQTYPYSPLAAIYSSGYKNHRGFDASANVSLTWNIPWVKGLSLKASAHMTMARPSARTLILLIR